jgi:hypothetical protein
MFGPKKPKGVIYVAETKCCGLKIHSPYDVAKPCHGRRPGEDVNKTDSYPSCKIIRYWVYKANRVYKATDESSESGRKT